MSSSRGTMNEQRARPMGAIRVRLDSESWSIGDEDAAVAEIVLKAGTIPHGAVPKIIVPVGVNNSSRAQMVSAGEYTVRVFLPSGEVMAESLSVTPHSDVEVRFDLRKSPREWLSFESAYGAVQRLPDVESAHALETWRDDPDDTSNKANYQRGDTRALVTQAIADLHAGSASVERISGSDRVPKIHGWRRLTTVDPKRNLPAARLSRLELVRWWTGVPEPESVALHVANHDERNAKFVAPDLDGQKFDSIAGERRVFAAIEDPMGGWRYAVFPEGWRRPSGPDTGTLATAQVLMTVVIGSVMRASTDHGEAARWRCEPGVADVEAMSYLGHLYSGQSAATALFLHEAQTLLFEKTMNPVAAAAGAFGLLTLSTEANAREYARWRDWVHNLYNWFPHLPDAAIAVAQMYLRFGDRDDDDLDVERLRNYALEAVRRGLPYLSFGINPLTEILLMLVRDDEQHGRRGPLVEDTARAYQLVLQLGAIATPGTFFTVLELGDVPA